MHLNISTSYLTPCYLEAEPDVDAGRIESCVRCCLSVTRQGTRGMFMNHIQQLSRMLGWPRHNVSLKHSHIPHYYTAHFEMMRHKLYNRLLVTPQNHLELHHQLTQHINKTRAYKACTPRASAFRII